MRRFRGKLITGMLLAALSGTVLVGPPVARAATDTSALRPSGSPAACGYEDWGDFDVYNPAGTVDVGLLTIWHNTCNDSIHTQVTANQPSSYINAYIGNGSIASSGDCHNCTRVDTRSEIPFVRGRSLAWADIYLCDGCEDNQGHVNF